MYKTELHLLANIPLDNSYNNVMDFPNAQTQLNWFMTHVVHTMEWSNVMYIRKDTPIKVDVNHDIGERCNYVLYNNHVTDKWMFAFITSKQYVSDNVMNITLETDVFSTYLFDFELRPSFIMRQHERRWNNGQPILSKTAEDMPLGNEYTLVNEQRYNPTGDVRFYLVESIYPLEKITHEGQVAYESYPNMVGGQPKMTFSYLFAITEELTSLQHFYVNGEEMTSLDECLTVVNYRDKPDLNEDKIIEYTRRVEAIQSITYLNDLPFPYDANISLGVVDLIISPLYGIVAEGIAGKYLRVSSAPFQRKTLGSFNYASQLPYHQPSDGDLFDAYHEPKLMCYPYTYIRMTDNIGGQCDYKPEYLRSTGSNTIRYSCDISSEPKTRFYIEGYRGLDDDAENSMHHRMSGGMNIVSDQYGKYLLSNRNQLGTENWLINRTFEYSQSRSEVEYKGGRREAITSNPFDWYSNLTSNKTEYGLAQNDNTFERNSALLNAAAVRNDARNQLGTVRVQGGSFTYELTNDGNIIRLQIWNVEGDIRDIIASMFHMYGYNCNRVLPVNLRTRKYWNYIQTTMCNLVASLDIDIISKLQAIFNRGTTVWHDGLIDVGDYSIENVEV